MTLLGLRSRCTTPRGVRVSDGLADRFEDRKKASPVLRRAGTSLKERRQGLPLDQLHREERALISEAAQFVNRDDARVLKLPADLGLLDEPADQGRVVPVLLQQHLDGQVAAEIGIASLEYRSHAAAGNLAQDLILLSVGLACGNLLRKWAGDRGQIASLRFPQQDARKGTQ